MKETVITWTITNWVTVFLMFISAAFVFGVIFKMISKARANKGG